LAVRPLSGVHCQQRSALGETSIRVTNNRPRPLFIHSPPPDTSVNSGSADDLWMLDPRQILWRDRLILTRDVAIAGERTEFYARVRAGEFVAVRRGVYMRADQWTALDVDEQYRARIHGTVAYLNSDPVVSHASAAALWKLPWFEPYPRGVHILGETAIGGRSTSAVVRHTVGVPEEIVWIDGIRVTSLARTVVDVARTVSFAQAVAVADAALRRTRFPDICVPESALLRADLESAVAELPVAHGSARARAVVAFADPDADRPGESVSRVNMSIARLTAPVLQAELRGASGRVWHVDFWWPQFNVIGEFDGKAKYTDDRYLRGRSPQQALYDEKLREDDLRRAGHGFCRWPWTTATSVDRLRALLIEAGVR
jgi:hypothetical protein